MKIKLTSFDAQEKEINHDYGKIYEVEETADSESEIFSKSCSNSVKWAKLASKYLVR